MPSTSLRLVTVPDTAPPYDCEAHGPACQAGRDTVGVDPLTARADPLTARADPLGNGQPSEPTRPAVSRAAGHAAPWASQS